MTRCAASSVPGSEGARGPCEAVRGDVAEDPRQLFLDIPAQVPREHQNFGGERGVALDVDRAQRVLLAAGERHKQLGLQRHGETCLSAPGFHGSPREDAQA